jgi:hypothetical protein
MNGVRLNTCMHLRCEHVLSHTRTHRRRLNYCGWPVPRNFFCRAVVTGCALPEWRATARCSEPLLFDSGPARNLIPTVKNHFIRHTTPTSYIETYSIELRTRYLTYHTYNQESVVLLRKEKRTSSKWQRSQMDTSTRPSGYLTRKKSICREDGWCSSSGVRVWASLRRI